MVSSVVSSEADDSPREAEKTPRSRGLKKSPQGNRGLAGFDRDLTFADDFYGLANHQDVLLSVSMDESDRNVKSMSPPA